MDSGKDPEEAGSVRTRARTLGRAAAPRSRVIWAAGGLLAAMLLLASFYQVLDQGMQRARQHWASPGPLAGQAGPCAVGTELQSGKACGPGDQAH